MAMTYEERRARNNACRRAYYRKHAEQEKRNVVAWRAKNPIKYAEYQIKSYQRRLEKLQSEVQANASNDD